ncbi:hypothetical protein DUNSADRAFT_52 [Dunaliella salina]|uniref:Uncharacterized protein n=1 Tax=Dunaliella salina TaxID=3046 RepID=A0ABQ7HAP5_DUNSA|nr:hypothetical protein DUNSADRAFT_52 [Dunaliella salina]|eukprot:KAF5843929.1 hypothetical protein DUNSADRAFT_52 [Dunaliella salina]
MLEVQQKGDWQAAWAQMEMDLGRMAAAKQILEAALQVDPGHMPSYKSLGLAEWITGRFSRAREVWRAACAPSPSGVPAAASPGAHSHGNGKGSSASVHAQSTHAAPSSHPPSALPPSPHSPMFPALPKPLNSACVPVLCTWASAEARAFNVRGARALLAEAAALQPRHPRVLSLTAALEDRAGNPSAAGAAFSAAQRGPASVHEEPLNGGSRLNQPSKGGSRLDETSGGLKGPSSGGSRLDEPSNGGTRFNEPSGGLNEPSGGLKGPSNGGSCLDEPPNGLEEPSNGGIHLNELANDLNEPSNGVGHLSTTTSSSRSSSKSGIRHRASQSTDLHLAGAGATAAAAAAASNDAAIDFAHARTAPAPATSALNAPRKPLQKPTPQPTPQSGTHPFGMCGVNIDSPYKQSTTSPATSALEGSNLSVNAAPFGNATPSGVATPGGQNTAASSAPKGTTPSANSASEADRPLATDGAPAPTLSTPAPALSSTTRTGGEGAFTQLLQRTEDTPLPITSAAAAAASAAVTAPQQLQDTEVVTQPTTTVDANPQQSPSADSLPARGLTDTTLSADPDNANPQRPPHPDSLPADPQLLHALAVHHLRHGRRAQAEQALVMMESLDGNNGFLCHTRGILLQQEGRAADAREWFARGTHSKGETHTGKAQEGAARAAKARFSVPAPLYVPLPPTTLSKGTATTDSTLRSGIGSHEALPGQSTGTDSSSNSEVGTDGCSNSLEGSSRVHSSMPSTLPSLWAGTDGRNSEGSGSNAESSTDGSKPESGDGCSNTLDGSSRVHSSISTDKGEGSGESGRNGSMVESMRGLQGCQDGKAGVTATEQGFAGVQEFEGTDACTSGIEDSIGGTANARGEGGEAAAALMQEGQEAAAAHTEWDKGTSAAKQGESRGEGQEAAAAHTQWDEGTSAAKQRESRAAREQQAMALVKQAAEMGLRQQQGQPRQNPQGPGSHYAGLSSRYLRQWALLEKKAGNRVVASELFDWKTWLAWAVFERRCGRLDVAEHAFRKGTAVAPGNPYLWYAYANMVWEDKKDVDGGRLVFRRATFHCPRAAPLWMAWCDAIFGGAWFVSAGLSHCGMERALFWGHGLHLRGLMQALCGACFVSAGLPHFGWRRPCSGIMVLTCTATCKLHIVLHAFLQGCPIVDGTV